MLGCRGYRKSWLKADVGGSSALLEHSIMQDCARKNALKSAPGSDVSKMYFPRSEINARDLHPPRGSWSRMCSGAGDLVGSFTAGSVQKFKAIIEAGTTTVEVLHG